MGKKLTALLLSLVILLTGCPVSGTAGADQAGNPVPEAAETNNPDGSNEELTIVDYTFSSITETKECKAIDTPWLYRQITMYDRKLGWALTTENEILFTDQGIENFKVIKEFDFGAKTDGYVTAAFPDARTAYLAYFTAENMLSVEYTHDGGQSWQTTVLDYTAFGTACDAGSIYLGFTDGQNGYLLCCSTPAAGSMTKILLATDDGGAHFSFLADLTNQIAGYPQGIAFHGNKGYIAVSYHGADSYLYTAADGGAAWNDEKIVPSESAIAYIDGYAPVFSSQSSNKGIIILKIVKENTIYQMFKTEDEKNWKLSGALPCDFLSGYTCIGEEAFLFWDSAGKLYEVSEY